MQIDKDIASNRNKIGGRGGRDVLSALNTWREPHPSTTFRCFHQLLFLETLVEKIKKVYSRNFLKDPLTIEHIFRGEWKGGRNRGVAG